MNWTTRKAKAKWDWTMAKRAMRNVDRDSLLHGMGLERRSVTADVFGGLGLFALGLVVGAGLGMMFAPSRGEEMRTRLGDAWRHRRIDELRGMSSASAGTTAPTPAM